MSARLRDLDRYLRDYHDTDAWKVGALILQRGWWRWRRLEVWCQSCIKLRLCRGSISSERVKDMVPVEVADELDLRCDPCGNRCTYRLQTTDARTIVPAGIWASWVRK